MDPLRLTDTAELRLLDEADADELYALVDANRGHLSGWMPWAGGQDLDRTIGFLRTTRQKQERGESLEGAIVVDGRIVGCAGFPIIDPIARVGIIGYWIAEEQEGRGLVTRAVSALIEHGFGEQHQDLALYGLLASER